MRDPRTLTAAQKKNNSRDSAGVIATLRNQRTREQRTIHIPGLLKAAVTELAERVDRDPEWRVVCLSTPNTIAEDLRGRRNKDSLGRRAPAFPNERLLAVIDRLDILEPATPRLHWPRKSKGRTKLPKRAA